MISGEFDVVVVGAGIAVLWYSRQQTDGTAAGLVWAGVILVVIAVLLLAGLTPVLPGQARVIQLFGKYRGTVRDPETGLEYTEPEMNRDIVTGKPIGESQLPKRFESMDYQILLVANKYQTGFDEPLLHTMYVDKRLDGVQAVQTLSR